MGTRAARSTGKLEQCGPRGVEQRRLDSPARENHRAAPRHRPPSARGATGGIDSAIAGTARPVLKSITDTRSSSTSSRSTVPAMTRPSGRVAAIGASASEPGAEQVGEARIGEHRAARRRRFRSRAAPSVDPGRALEPAQRRGAALVGRDRGQAARARVDQGPALGRGALLGARRRRAPRDPRPIADGASGRGGRASARRRVARPSRDATAARAAGGRRAGGGARPGPTPRQRSPPPHGPSIARLRAERRQRALDAAAVPAVLGAPRRARLDAGDHQPLGGAGQADVEQPPMLLEVARLLGASISSANGRTRSSLRGRSSGDRADARRSASRAIAAVRPSLRRIGGRVGEDHDRRFQALGAVDGHHPHRIGRRRRDRA